MSTPLAITLDIGSSLLTRHGRATPLVWLSVEKTTLKNQRL